MENAVYKAELQEDLFGNRMDSERNLRQGDLFGSYYDSQKGNDEDQLLTQDLARSRCLANACQKNMAR